jgi:hypothetical protein
VSASLPVREKPLIRRNSRKKNTGRKRRIFLLLLMNDPKKPPQISIELSATVPRASLQLGRINLFNFGTSFNSEVEFY